MRIYWDTTSAPGIEPISCRWMFGFNLPLYALGLPIAPDAVATDGLLDVCTFERGAMWSVARYLWHVARRMHLTLPDAQLCLLGDFAWNQPTGPTFRINSMATTPEHCRLTYEMLTRQTATPGFTQTAAARLGIAVPPQLVTSRPATANR